MVVASGRAFPIIYRRFTRYDLFDFSGVNQIILLCAVGCGGGLPFCS